VKARRVKKLDPAGSLVENAARIVTVRLDEMRSFAPRALEAEADREQHDLRIAAKRLRYVLEVTGFCFGRAAKTARLRARDLQDVLGELHDCDVMLPRIEAQISDLRDEDAKIVCLLGGDATDLDPALVARAPHRTAYRGLDVLAVYVQARRKLLFERFVDLWTEIDRSGTWSTLERAVERKVAEARERCAAAKRAAAAEREFADAERAEREAAERARRAAEELAAARGDRGEADAADRDRPDGGVRPVLRRVL
jgi:CHAD domain